MTDALTELPPGAVLAETWEDCAAHLEAHGDMGGEVWIKDPQGRWHRGDDTAGDLRGLSSAPGKGRWFPRALIPPKWRRTRREVTDDFIDGTRTIREWVNGGGVYGPRLCEELDAWLDYWGGSTPQPTPSPVPPWPGAVLSGCVDEDGVPTWLAQAGQVRGEQVRHATTWPWRKLVDGLDDDTWVEVRAPRAVPAPETERVPWWEAVGRVVPDVGTIREVGMSGDQAWVRCGDYDPDGVAPDGTVEVLRDGDR